jgi:putative exosortase-associated protein (TIGR04073 family)
MCLASSAWGYNDYGRDMGVKPLGKSQSEAASGDYGSDVGMKLGTALSNLTLGWLEIPKNALNTTNQTNLALGLSGGLIKGVLHGAGRTLAGMVDLLSFPLPTQPIADPQFVWQNFDVDTHFNPLFQLKH